MPQKSFEETLKEEEEFIGRKLSPHEVESVKERVDYFKLHEGHEAEHSEMILIIIVGLVISQILISLWKRYHPTSYSTTTLLGLWILPMVLSLRKGYWKFLLIWCLFSAVNSWVVARALQRPMQSGTPRLVYSWFQRVYDVSIVAGGIGYFITLCSFFHLPMMLGADIDGEADVFLTGMMIMFYGLYFGTLGRDFVDRVSDIMATTMGYYSKQGFPTKHLRQGTCAICGIDATSGPEECHELNCGHVYHELCIRGWTIVGKKDVCPYCKEKVDLAPFKKHVWDSTQAHFLNLVDFMRYIIVWNPVAFLVIHWVINILGLK